jgi:ketosteroid isomerase-like protein
VDAYREQLEQLRDSFNSRDSNGFAAVWHPTCEWHPFLTARVEGDLGYHGHNGIRAWFEDTDEMFSDVRVDLDQFREVRGRLVVLGRMTAISRGSGAEVSSEVGWVIEPRGEKLQRGWAYTTHAEAERDAESLAPIEPRS